MRKSLRYKKKRGKSKNKTRKTIKSKGGSYYPYNTNPIRFTTSTTPQTGGFSLSLDPRNTFFPDSVMTLVRNVEHILTPTTVLGSFDANDPNPSIQPIMNKTIKY